MHTRMTAARRNVVIAIAVLACGVLGTALFRNFDPTAASYFPKCQLHELTGLHCPGCGATRAVNALVDGHWMDALRFNPLLIIGLPIIAMGFWYQRRRERRGMPSSAALPICVTIVVLGYFVARNVPSPARSWLAPPSAEQATFPLRSSPPGD